MTEDEGEFDDADTVTVLGSRSVRYVLWPGGARHVPRRHVVALGGCGVLLAHRVGDGSHLPCDEVGTNRCAGRDPVRRFGGMDRAAILLRSGGRCEQYGLLFGRCKQTEKLHADYVRPHSKGGSTTVANGQVLCSRHNKQKAARIPFDWELRRLEKKRSSYFPAVVSGAVVRRASSRAVDAR
jgi:hypothetical protein